MSEEIRVVAAVDEMSRIADWPAARVRARKADRTVAVILPARNEEQTVGDIVCAVLDEHGDGLVDEVVVVDSASTDRTAELATSAGARVVSADRPGKGEAMWQGVAATKSDLLVFLDADLERFDPRFVPALLGPLLVDSRVAFVKGAYDRRTEADVTVGGGRVTELTARPLLAAFWPELGRIVQPLGGEYAARRDLLEQLPFRCGYGVDIGLLLDTDELLGPGAIAQVDLHERFHSHSGLSALGRMAAEVLHTVIDRLISQGRLAADATASTSLLQPIRIEDGFGHTHHDIDVSERPPLRTVLESGLEQVGA
ncbi:MAG TPA: glucosyl-3-phosphoglycerate synthase [Mycobacteriales bacterium]|jgi:glucosyl-3-phosphoglycerate synthase|nr:glucosyl-3-phosphoglycerate synthase [Mycobacteriales bacterium]HVX69896.1 glucosyl-3-phosphoglycerate synthase [Mycobacteriales bacterium]